MNIIRGNIIILTVFLLAAPAVYAGEDYSAEDLSAQAAQWKEKRKEKMQKIFNELDLTEEQKAKLKENKAKHRKQRKAAFEKMKSHKETLKQELLKTDLNMKRVRKIQGELKASQAQMADDRLDSILEVRQILTPEQFAKFTALMEQHRAKKWDRSHKMRQGDAAPEAGSPER